MTDSWRCRVGWMQTLDKCVWVVLLLEWNWHRQLWHNSLPPSFILKICIFKINSWWKVEAHKHARSISGEAMFQIRIIHILSLHFQDLLCMKMVDSVVTITPERKKTTSLPFFRIFCMPAFSQGGSFSGLKGRHLRVPSHAGCNCQQCSGPPWAASRSARQHNQQAADRSVQENEIRGLKSRSIQLHRCSLGTGACFQPASCTWCHTYGSHPCSILTTGFQDNERRFQSLYEQSGESEVQGESIKRVAEVLQRAKLQDIKYHLGQLLAIAFEASFWPCYVRNTNLGHRSITSNIGCFYLQSANFLKREPMLSRMFCLKSIPTMSTRTAALSNASRLILKSRELVDA